MTFSYVRVRFAPSPTGHLHLGGLRTAFYNYLFAKQHGGQFILRIEDTDQTRIVPGSSEDIENVLTLCSLKPDESPKLGGSYGPYLQSQRLNLYKDQAHVLLESGKAYRCFCSPARLDLLRKYQARNREKIRYDGKCKNLSPADIKEKLGERGSRHVIRFALSPGQDTFDDLIFGTITNNLVGALESDPVIIKSDQYPTYHLANVVDDHTMKISHVLRGSEWISSTAKHVQLYKAFGWQEPEFAHFPLITMRDGSKMSKRNCHSHVKSWIEAGYSPIALFNFLTNTGGGVPKIKQDSMELWSLQKFVEGFDFSQMTCHPSSIDINRLNIYSAKELQQNWQNDPDKVMRMFYTLLKDKNIEADIGHELARTIVGQLINRLTTLNDLLSQDFVYIWRHPTLTWDKREYLDKSWDMKAIVEDVIKFALTDDIQDKDKFIGTMKRLSEKHGIDYGQFMKFLRKLLTNIETGLPIFDICNCLGAARLLRYLNSGLKYISD